MEPSCIRDVKPGTKNLNMLFIILEVGRSNVTKDGHEVRTCKIADNSASANLSVWDDPGLYIKSGDICRLSKGYASVWKGCLTIYIGKGGEIQKVGEFCLQFNETPNISEPNAEYLQQSKINTITERSSPTLQQPIQPASVPGAPSPASAGTGPLTGNGNHGTTIARGINRNNPPRLQASSNNGIKSRGGRRT